MFLTFSIKLTNLNPPEDISVLTWTTFLEEAVKAQESGSPLSTQAVNQALQAKKARLFPGYNTNLVDADFQQISEAQYAEMKQFIDQVYQYQQNIHANPAVQTYQHHRAAYDEKYEQQLEIGKWASIGLGFAGELGGVSLKALKAARPLTEAVEEELTEISKGVFRDQAGQLVAKQEIIDAAIEAEEAAARAMAPQLDQAAVVAPVAQAEELVEEVAPRGGLVSWWQEHAPSWLGGKPKPEVPPPAAVVKPVVEPAEEVVEEIAEAPKKKSVLTSRWQNYQASRQAAKQAKLAQQALTQSRENVTDAIARGINQDLDTQLQTVAGRQFTNAAEAQAQAKEILNTQLGLWQATSPITYNRSYIYGQAYDRLKSLQPDLPEEQLVRMAQGIEDQIVAQRPSLISGQLDRLQPQTVKVAQSTAPKVTTATGLDQGLVRESQQDAIFTTSSLASYQGTFTPRIADGTKEALGDLAIAADGMGGMAGGGKASHNAITVFYQNYYNPKFQAGRSIEERMATAIREANRVVYNDLQGSGGTTLTATVLKDNQLTIAHVGDTRAYLVRGNSIQQLTTDHTGTAQNILIRAIGSEPTVQVDTAAITIQPGDKIILCSDGLNKHVTDQEIFNIVTNNNPQQAESKLINLTNQRGATDNTAVIVQDIGKPTTMTTTQTTVRVKPIVEVKPKGAIDKVLDWFKNLFSSRLVESAWAATEESQPMSLYLYQAVNQNKLIQEKLAGRKPEELSTEELNQIILEALQESEATIQAKQEKIGQDYKLFTGIDGSSQYELSPGSYRLKIKPLPDLSFSAPTVINIASGAPQQLEIGLRRGGENVSWPAAAWRREKTTDAALLTVILYHDENANYIREAEEKTVKWAGVEIELEKITPLPYRSRPLFWCSSNRVLNAGVHQSGNQCFVCVRTGFAIGRNVVKVQCPE